MDIHIGYIYIEIIRWFLVGQPLEVARRARVRPRNIVRLEGRNYLLDVMWLDGRHGHAMVDKPFRTIYIMIHTNFIYIYACIYNIYYIIYIYKYISILWFTLYMCVCIT